MPPSGCLNSTGRRPDSKSALLHSALRRALGEKGCQWILNYVENHAIWDWNIANHTKAINFYREVAEANPDTAFPYMYLLDNLAADHRADEAERWPVLMNRLRTRSWMTCWRKNRKTMPSSLKRHSTMPPNAIMKSH
jgi:hypothetical protein